MGDRQVNLAFVWLRSIATLWIALCFVVIFTKTGPWASNFAMEGLFPRIGIALIVSTFELILILALYTGLFFFNTWAYPSIKGEKRHRLFLKYLFPICSFFVIERFVFYFPDFTPYEPEWIKIVVPALAPVYLFTEFTLSSRLSHENLLNKGRRFAFLIVGVLLVGPILFAGFIGVDMIGSLLGAYLFL